MFLLRFFLFSFVRLLRTRHQNGAAVDRTEPSPQKRTAVQQYPTDSEAEGAENLLLSSFAHSWPEFLKTAGIEGGRNRRWGRAPSPATEQENRRRMVVDAWRRRRKKWKRWREGLVSCSSWEEGEGQRGACLAYFISPPFFGILLYLGTFVMWERGRTKDKVCTAAFTLSRRAVLY